jgi:hypothetical protein
MRTLLFILFIANLMTYNATDRCTTDRSESTATRKGSASDSTDARTDRSVPIPR